jgi:alpha-galactosidase
MKKSLVIFIMLLVKVSLAQERNPVIRTSPFSIRMSAGGDSWSYRAEGSANDLVFKVPVFEIDGRQMTAQTGGFSPGPVIFLGNGTKEQVLRGNLNEDPTLQLAVCFRWAEDNPMLRFRYTLSSSTAHHFSKTSGRGHLEYYSVSLASQDQFREIRLSDFNQKIHATCLEEMPVEEKDFEDSTSLMGPLLEARDGRFSYVLAYEHGSQYPDRYLEFSLRPGRSVTLRAVKGNYLNGQPLNRNHDYETIWFEAGGIAGDENRLASAYRTFILKYISLHTESREAYIYYDTWGRQERTKWAGGTYLSSMNLETTLKEIEVAHRMGIEVYLLDAGWFMKTGDWMVNTKPAFFPDSLKQVKALLDKYGMKLGLWLSPTVAAVSSNMLRRNRNYQAEWKGKKEEPAVIWETEKSVTLDLVSPYWSDFADELIRLTRELGVSYYTWDGIGQYGNDGPNGFHGTDANSAQERADSYSFQLPIYLSKIVDKVCAAEPQVIFDLDITEEYRTMGLEFLSSGKYLILNNGAYFHNFDLAKPWQTPLANGNLNIFVNPGPARGWFTRPVLTYDKWLPSILFLTYYQTDEPRNSQLINLASLILGQNGLWGEILKTSPEGIRFIHDILEKYKQVRGDVTVSDPVRRGEPGFSSEIVEKINGKNGRGEVVIFSNGGHYRYITEHPVDKRTWCTEHTKVSFDSAGRAIIDADFDGSSAGIVFFGVQ